MTNVMLDLETLGTRPGSVVLSIGAVVFDEDGVHEQNTFHQTINVTSAKVAGLTTDQSTLDWWRKQSEAAQQVLARAENPLTSRPLATVLQNFSEWFPKGAKIHGNGSDFDLPLLGACYYAANMRPPWKYYDVRCYRTLKALMPDLPVVRLGLYHDALDDARTQAAHAVKIMQAIRDARTSQAAPPVPGQAEDARVGAPSVEPDPQNPVGGTFALAQAGTLMGGHKPG